ncbi:MAG: ribonuclease P protein component [Phycisphaerales bacterium]|nr:ribonuclease P protein component [Phycisphaerales bacterium]
MGQRLLAGFCGETRHSIGPLTLWAKPNELTHSRLGLSVSRAVGNAVQRNQIKRLLREAFRLLQHELPAGYDFIIVVYKHELRELNDYQQLLKRGSESLHKLWLKRR